jgi:hypothetical protein
MENHGKTMKNLSTWMIYQWKIMEEPIKIYQNTDD